MLGSALFLALIGALLFAFALAMQMRMMIGVVIARALRARDSVLGIPESRLAVVLAANGEAGGEPVKHIQDTYPDQMKHLRLARTVSKVTPFLVLAVIVAGRLAGRL